MSEAPRRIEQAADGLDQLKALLFKREASRLEEIGRAVELLDGRVGDARRLERATAEIIVEALRDAEVARHRELADAIAPVVVAAIRNEIRNSREMMVEALYPLTGQMVAAAVSNAIREAVAALDRQLDALTSIDRWKLRLKSKLTGRPVGELAMARAGRGRIVRILFLENGSGRVIANWREGAGEDENVELVGGLIAAITGFARDTLDAGANELRALDLGDRKLLLRSSPRTIAAAEVEGNLSRDQEAALDRAFLALLRDYAEDDAVETPALASFAERVNAAGPNPAARRTGPQLKVLAAILVLLLGGAAWRAGSRWWQDRRIDAAFGSLVAARPWLGAFPISTSVDHAASRVEIRGLAPSAEDARAIADALKDPAGAYTVASQIALVSTAGGLEALERRGEAIGRELAAARETVAALSLRAATGDELAALRERVEALSRGAAAVAQLDEARARLDGLARNAATREELSNLRGRFEALTRDAATAAQVDETRARIDALTRDAAKIAETSEAVAALAAKLGGVTERLDTPRARLVQLLDGFAIFFADREKLADEARSLPRLDDIADLMKRENLGVRVVGHTDASGGPTQNLAISRRRAEIVADLLDARGVDRKQIVVVARAANFPIAEQDPGTRERNRRVTFEALYENEAPP